MHFIVPGNRVSNRNKKNGVLSTKNGNFRLPDSPLAVGIIFDNLTVLPDKKIPILRFSTGSVYEGHTRNHFDDFNPIKINRITTAKGGKVVAKW